MERYLINYNKYKLMLAQQGGNKCTHRPSSYPAFVILSNKERKNITKSYNKACQSLKDNENISSETICDATSGMYISSDKRCGSIKELERACKKGTVPTVQSDSLTAWCNQAAEQYGLEVRDIIKLNPGDKLEVILMDRNVGDYMHDTKAGTKYDPRKKGLSYGVYTHQEGLTGILEIKDTTILNPWTWEVNAVSLGGSFWSPLKSITKRPDWEKLDPQIKVGFRGPSINKQDAEHLPKLVKHYDNWWNDYSPFRTQDFMNVKRIK